MECWTLKNVGLFQYHRTSETVYVLWWFYDFNQILQKSTLPQWWQSNWMYNKSYTCLLHCICHWLWSGFTWEKAYGNLFIPIVPALLHIHPIRYKSKNKHWIFFIIHGITHIYPPKLLHWLCMCIVQVLCHLCIVYVISRVWKFVQLIVVYRMEFKYTVFRYWMSLMNIANI